MSKTQIAQLCGKFSQVPHTQRINQVYSALDTASRAGATTYDSLIDFVHTATGQCCSRKLVSKWKKERQITVAGNRFGEEERGGGLVPTDESGGINDSPKSPPPLSQAFLGEEQEAKNIELPSPESLTTNLCKSGQPSNNDCSTAPTDPSKQGCPDLHRSSRRHDPVIAIATPSTNLPKVGQPLSVDLSVPTNNRCCEGCPTLGKSIEPHYQEEQNEQPSTKVASRSPKPIRISLFIAATVLGIITTVLNSDRISAAKDRLIGRKPTQTLLNHQQLSLDRTLLLENYTKFKSALAQAQTTEPSPTNKPSGQNRLVFNLTISSPKDLKVKEGDRVEEGQIIAERVEEQATLRAQLRALHLEYQQIQSREVPTPPPPGKIPAIDRLPPISYAEEEAAIASAALNVRQLERAYQLQQQSLKKPPIEESAAYQRAAVEVQNQLRLVDNQRRKIDTVATLKELPETVMAHESEVLKQKEASLLQAQSDHEQAGAKLIAAQNAATERLQQLGAALEKARAEHTVAIAKLQTKKDQRAYTEYEASIIAAQRVEEQNQATQSYSRALTEALQQQRDRSFAIAQLQDRIALIDEKIRNLSVVTSPYTGIVRNIKIMRQNDVELSCELTLDIAGGTGVPKQSPNKPSTVPTPTIPTPNTYPDPTDNPPAPTPNEPSTVPTPILIKLLPG